MHTTRKLIQICCRVQVDVKAS